MHAPAPGTTPIESTFVRTVKYFYFLRFSIMLWTFLPALAAIDAFSSFSGLTRGIVALEDAPQLILAGFFVTIVGWVALLSARITSAYGKERFDTEPPWFFAVTGEEMSHGIFWSAQAPGFLVLGYVWWQTTSEQGATQLLPKVLNATWLLLGVVIALVCWTLMAGIYYWLFWAGQGIQRRAKAFVVPYSEAFDNLKKKEPAAPLLALLGLVENSVSWAVSIGKRFGAKKGATWGNGYVDPERGQLAQFKVHSGHALAFLSLAFLATIYLAFWYFAAPVLLKNVRLMVRIIFAIGAVFWAWLTFWAKRRFAKRFAPSDLIRMIILFFPMIIVVSLPVVWDNHPFAMPVLGFVTVLVMFVLWFLWGIAFFLDRFRVPVLTSAAALLLAAGFLGDLPGATDDHYLKSSQVGKGLAFNTPGTILKNFQSRSPMKSASNVDSAGTKRPQPMIIVTATGGGIHAASWTSAVLQAIEDDFKNNPAANLGTFHDSILLMSTVSGGSVGAVPWLTNYRSGSGFDSDVAHKIAECSDLQAVAWGLTYADFLRVLWPFRWSNLGKTLNTYDRGWALEQAFWRNRVTGCKSDKLASPEDPITIGSLAGIQNMPAFSLNTTAEETGSRWLISNYVVRQRSGEAEITPAASFLDHFQRDIPLSTAARLSANFPYVSPMARLEPPAHGYHFGDGGYFDNDGTATALEFLWYALNVDARIPRQTGGSASPNTRIPILILEIRDGPDPRDADDDSNLKKKWSGLTQGVAPVATFYNANHVSVTRRNRRELCFMENALRQKANFTHIVVPYLPDPQKECPDEKECPAEPQPLSWHLTARQKNQITTALGKIDATMVRNWYLAATQSSSDQQSTPAQHAIGKSSQQGSEKLAFTEKLEMLTCSEKKSALKLDLKAAAK